MHRCLSIVASASTLVAILAVAPAQAPRLLLDVNAVPVPNNPSDPSGFAVVGGTVFFAARQDFFGRELYRTNGQPNGTTRVADIASGAASSNPEELTAVGNRVFFRASTAALGTELWVSDGTAAGTRAVVDLRSGAAGSNPGGMVAAGGRLFFFADDGGGRRLWSSDGTVAGTLEIATAGGQPLTSIDDLIAGPGGCYITATVGASGLRVVRSDGRSSAGVIVLPSPAFRGLSVDSGRVWFVAQRGGRAGPTPHWTDGSQVAEIGVVLPTRLRYRAIVPGGQLAVLAVNPVNSTADLVLTASVGSFAFTGFDLARLHVGAAGAIFGGASPLPPVAGVEPWRTDGTAAGTYFLADVIAGAANSDPDEFVEIANRTWFTAAAFTGGSRFVWASDGTRAGTSVVSGNQVGYASARRLSRCGNRALFASRDFLQRFGDEPWSSDGTVAGTVRLGDLRAGAQGSDPRDFFPLANGTTLFTADDGVVGRELWITDGTPAGTRLLEDINRPPFGATFSAEPREFSTMGALTFFSADDGVVGRELWVTDGTSGGTIRVADIRPGSAGSSPRGFAVIGQDVYFVADDGVRGEELWKSDGTAAGTVLVRDIRPGPGGSEPTTLTALGFVLYFTADDGNVGRELWKSDGTAAGTLLAADIEPGAQSSAPSELLAIPGSNVLYFSASRASVGRELFSSLGTPASTRPVGDLDPNGSSRPEGLTAFDGTVLFSADDGSRGREPWVYDPARGTTELLRNLAVGSSNPRDFVVVRGSVLFTADDGAAGRELWATDGTTAGTRLLRDVRVGSFGSEPSDLLVRNGALFFSADDGVSGREPWFSDGTPIGTRLLRDVAPGRASSGASGLAFGGSRNVYLRADDGVAGAELWRTDGRPVFGTQRVSDLWPGSAGSSPAEIHLANGSLLFVANDGVKGREVYVFDPGATAWPFALGCGRFSRIPTLETGDPVLPSVVAISGRRGFPGAFAVPVLGLRNRVPPNFGNLCFSQVDLGSSFTLPAVTVSAGGQWQSGLPLPNIPALSGLQIAVQIWFGPTDSPIGLDLSDAVLWTLGV